MKEIIVAFDVDGTLIRNDSGNDMDGGVPVANERIRTLLITLSSFKNVKNLEWCTASENSIHARKAGLMGGERHNTAKLKNKDVQNIRKIYAKGGINMRELGKIYGVRQSTISQIIRRVTWKYI